MLLLGATAIEDKLQDGVPEAVAALGTAGIHLWVLTGDRQETAINIGYSCRLLNEDMTLLVAPEPDSAGDGDGGGSGAGGGGDGVAAWVETRLEQLHEHTGHENEALAMVIGGRALASAMATEALADRFLELARTCKSVICCRVSPLQKSEVVQLVRKRVTGAVTLAIGDGANDVAMIQAAHIGVGISGQEGMQAARASDYSLAQFRFLTRLLLVHGSRSYQRMSKVILYTFYKNIALYFVQFWFCLWNGYSGQILFERWTIGLYNVMFTALPVIVIGVFDKNISSENLVRVPQLYQSGPRCEFFNHRVFASWVANSLFHSALMFYGCVAALEVRAPPHAPCA